MNQQRRWVGVGWRMVGREEGEDGLINFEIFKDSLLQKQNLVESARSVSAKLHGTTVSPSPPEIPNF
jgi:hypothetical protein